MNRKHPVQPREPEPGQPTDPAMLRFASQLGELSGRPSTHDCRALRCSGGLHHCQNQACDRQVIMTHQYCCQPCEHGARRGTQVSPAGTAGRNWMDCHSRLCEDRHAERSPGPACSRCGARPAPNQARDLCFECDLETPLCDRCYVGHAREAIADAEDDRPTSFYHGDYRREKLQLAADVVRLGRPARTTQGGEAAEADDPLYCVAHHRKVRWLPAPAWWIHDDSLSLSGNPTDPRGCSGMWSAWAPFSRRIP